MTTEVGKEDDNVTEVGEVGDITKNVRGEDCEQQVCGRRQSASKSLPFCRGWYSQQPQRE